MTAFTFTSPEGKSYTVNGPDGATQEQAWQILQQQLQPPQQSAQSQPFSAQRMVSNVPSSALNFGKSIVDAVKHPINTLGTLKDIGEGAVQSALPQSMQSESAAPQRELAARVGQYFKERYGGTDKFAKALESDPVGVLGDVSILFTGGESAAAKVPALAKAAEVAGRATNPLHLATAIPSKVLPMVGNKVAEVIGTAGTHTGGNSLKAAYQAGRDGGEAADTFRANISGDVPLDQVVTDAKAALGQMRQDRGAAYRSGMADVGKDKTVLDFQPIDDAFAKQKAVGSYKGKTIDPSTADVKAQIGEALDDWRSSDPAEFHTPEGFDALKKKIGDIRDSTPERTPSRKVADSVYNAIKNEIVKQAPEYAKVMKDYETGSQALTEIEKTLSLGKNAASDTSLRKLQSVLRSDVNANFGKRLDLVQTLEQAGGKNLQAAIAGQSLKQLAPRGLGGAAMVPNAGAAAYLFHNPFMAVPTLALQSPRLMGEAAYGTGALARALAGTGGRISKDRAELAGLLLSEAGQNR